MGKVRNREGDSRLPLVMGFDVAGFGDDRSAIFLRCGGDARSWPIEKHHGLDLMTLAGRVAERAAAERWDSDGAKPLYANKRADLCGVEYGFNGKNEIQLEKKDDMKKRGLASPDLADALALTFAHPVSAGSWDLPPTQQFYETDYDPFAKFDEDYWWGEGDD